MTLNEMADLVCSEIKQTEQDDLLLCKKFIKLGFKLIWQAALWKDSVFEYTQTLNSTGYALGNTWLPSSNTLLLPSIFTHVLAGRTADRRLNVESSEIFYRADFNAFANTGNATQYRLLRPVALQFDSSVPLIIYSTFIDKFVTFDYLNDTTLAVVRFTGPLIPAQEFTTSRIDMFRTDPTLVVIFASGAGNNPEILRTAPPQASLPLHQRIQLIGNVPDGAVIRVLGKISPPTFTADDDEPGLTGVDNCLIAYGQMRMLRSIRQYGKAADMRTELVALLDQLKAEQVVQQAHNKRLIPETGYGDEYGLLSGVFTTLSK